VKRPTWQRIRRVWWRGRLHRWLAGPTIGQARLPTPRCELDDTHGDCQPERASRVGILSAPAVLLWGQGREASSPCLMWGSLRQPADLSQLPMLEAASPSTHKPFIDGLRALATLAVLAFHFGFAHCSGGFVGVDVFFVISAFLIIGQLNTALSDGRPSLAESWTRRVLRILPPYLLVVAGSVALGCPYLGTISWPRLASSTISPPR
jgi:hypothetical protein